MKRRDILNSSKLTELKRQRRKNLQNKILYISGFVLALLIVFVATSHINKLRIKNINISGNKVIDTDKIELIIRDTIKGNYLYILPKSSFLFLPKEKIIDNLTTEYGRLKDINFHIDNTESMSVSLAEREGKYIWCGDVLSVESISEDNPCSFMDESGYVFDIAPFFSGNVYFRFFGILDNKTFSKNIWPKIMTLKERVENMGLKPVALYIKDDGDMNIYLSSRSVLTEAPEIRFKKDFVLEKTVENLQAAVATEPLLSDLKNKNKTLEYIDLRFGNKVYFKFRP